MANQSQLSHLIGGPETFVKGCLGIFMVDKEAYFRKQWLEDTLLS